MKIVSLLPAATEIVGALGLLDDLLGVSHECDFPPEAAGKPRVTRSDIPATDLPSGEVDRWVRESLASRGTLYRMDEPLLRRMEPDLILTQKLCDVCAVGYGSVLALSRTLPGPPQVVHLEPQSLGDVFRDIASVAEILGVPERGREVVSALTGRVEAVRRATAAAKHRPRCLLLEWIDPPYRCGHWNPELVEIAGGDEVLGQIGERSAAVPWVSVLASRPDVIVLACCGYTVRRTLQDVPILENLPGWQNLPAVRSGRVHAVDGCAFFSRPGPRLVDSLEILAEILHPELFAGRFPDRGAVRLSSSSGR